MNFICCFLLNTKLYAKYISKKHKKLIAIKSRNPVEKISPIFMWHIQIDAKTTKNINAKTTGIINQIINNFINRISIFPITFSHNVYSQNIIVRIFVF